MLSSYHRFKATFPPLPQHYKTLCGNQKKLSFPFTAQKFIFSWILFHHLLRRWRSNETIQWIWSWSVTAVMIMLSHQLWCHSSRNILTPVAAVILNLWHRKRSRWFTGPMKHGGEKPGPVLYTPLWKFSGRQSLAFTLKGKQGVIKVGRE